MFPYNTHQSCFYYAGHSSVVWVALTTHVFLYTFDKKLFWWQHDSNVGIYAFAGSLNAAQLTFRSLSLSRNISLSTSLVSAARTVCRVAVEQRLWRGGWKQWVLKDTRNIMLGCVFIRKKENIHSITDIPTYWKCVQPTHTVYSNVLGAAIVSSAMHYTAHLKRPTHHHPTVPSLHLAPCPDPVDCVHG